MSFQQIIVTGNVGKEAEIKYLANGTAVANFSVAVSETKGKGDAKEEITTWFRVSCFGNLAEIAGQYVKRGMKVLVAGKVKVNVYSASDGTAKASLEITANELRMLSSKADSGAADASGQTGADYAAKYSGTPKVDPSKVQFSPSPDELGW